MPPVALHVIELPRVRVAGEPAGEPVGEQDNCGGVGGSNRIAVTQKPSTITPMVQAALSVETFSTPEICVP